MKDLLESIGIILLFVAGVTILVMASLSIISPTTFTSIVESIFGS